MLKTRFKKENLIIANSIIVVCIALMLFLKEFYVLIKYLGLVIALGSISNAFLLHKYKSMSGRVRGMSIFVAGVANFVTYFTLFAALISIKDGGFSIEVIIMCVTYFTVSLFSTFHQGDMRTEMYNERLGQ